MKKTVANAAPKPVAFTKKSETEAFSTKQLPVEDIDQDRDNPQLVSYYAKDIYQYLRQLEVSALLFSQQTFLHWSVVKVFMLCGLEILCGEFSVHGWLLHPTYDAYHFGRLAC